MSAQRQVKKLVWQSSSSLPETRLSHSCFSFLSKTLTFCWFNKRFIPPSFHEQSHRAVTSCASIDDWEACNEGEEEKMRSNFQQWREKSFASFSHFQRSRGRVEPIYSSNELNLAQKTTSMAGLVLIHPHGHPQLAACLEEKKSSRVHNAQRICINIHTISEIVSNLIKFVLIFSTRKKNLDAFASILQQSSGELSLPAPNDCL